VQAALPDARFLHFRAPPFPAAPAHLPPFLAVPLLFPFVFLAALFARLASACGPVFPDARFPPCLFAPFLSLCVLALVGSLPFYFFARLLSSRASYQSLAFLVSVIARFSVSVASSLVFGSPCSGPSVISRWLSAQRWRFLFLFLFCLAFAFGSVAFFPTRLAFIFFSAFPPRVFAFVYSRSFLS
jgi:hypothetical protein